VPRQSGPRCKPKGSLDRVLLMARVDTGHDFLIEFYVRAQFCTCRHEAIKDEGRGGADSGSYVSKALWAGSAAAPHLRNKRPSLDGSLNLEHTQGCHSFSRRDCGERR
jgi:hypothetical protein